MPRLHVVIPVFNERGTLEDCLRRVLAVRLPVEWSIRIWMVDDHSDSENYQAVQRILTLLLEEKRDITLTRHDVNQGKGAALQTGFDQIIASDASDDDLVIIQDADLEYDPDDYPSLMMPLLEGNADVVLGTRWGEHHKLEGLKRKIHAWGNSVLTSLSNLMTGFKVSDMECCYKVFSVQLLRRLRPMLSERRFGIEPQMVASFARLRARVLEVPIQYDPRSLSAGKKIGWTDGVRAFWVITRERMRSTSSVPPTPRPDTSPDVSHSRTNES